MENKVTTHTELINELIKKYNLESYCEIGVQKRRNNFDKIICQNKYGVDPDPQALADFIGTSDDFFAQNKNKYSIFFIDGLHTADQVKKDFENSLRSLNDNGFIVIHDCLPEDESTTHVPRDSRIWHGDVYKFCMNIGQYENINYKTFNIDNGCMLIWKEEGNKRWFWHEDITWDMYLKNGKELMNVTDSVEI